ncbi:MAG: hypothetical protein A3J28_18955 [Acidobacteria bacterium RIFCSPLOWO2_12_FULL_60_22]|nr:MAG: hypothetical protein A3J28_18955 [Acidobacteria bacterium RIFCSPLOWO2_12_FULL_60_22]
MDVAAQNTLLLLVGVIAALVITQTIVLLVFVLAMRKWTNRMAAVAENAVRNAEPVLLAARDLLVDGKEKLNLVSQNLVEISQLTKNQVVRLDGLVSDASDRVRLQLIRLDQLLSHSANRVEETTEVIQRSILAPVREISAILVGVRTAVDYLLRRNKTRMERATQEEELFI